MYSQIFLTASVLEASEAPRNSPSVGETGTRFKIPFTFGTTEAAEGVRGLAGLAAFEAAAVGVVVAAAAALDLAAMSRTLHLPPIALHAVVAIVGA